MNRIAFLLAALPLALGVVASPAAADHDEEVIVESQPVEAGPVSTTTPRVTRQHQDEDFLTSLQRCVEGLQVGVQQAGCPDH